MSDNVSEIPYISSAEQSEQDSRTNAELISAALLEKDEDERWPLISMLHFRGTPDIFEAASKLIVSNDAFERQLGVDILAQLDVPNKAFREKTVDLLIGLLGHEANTGVLWSIGIALGHLDDPHAIEPLSKLKNHPHRDVRCGVVHGVSGHVDALAVQTLIELSTDVDADVRDWATFGLGQILSTHAEDIPAEIDLHAVCDALYARVTDEHNDTRNEALMGLVLWQDKRVIEPLIHELSLEDSDGIEMLALEAATELGDPRLCEALLRLEECWRDEPNRFLEEVQKALVTCKCAGTSITT